MSARTQAHTIINSMSDAMVLSGVAKIPTSELMYFEDGHWEACDRIREELDNQPETLSASDVAVLVLVQYLENEDDYTHEAERAGFVMMAETIAAKFREQKI